MARLPRFVLPGYPQHVVQRGHDQERILFEEDDYWFLWEHLQAAAERFSCAVHAYSLLPGRFHLLLTPALENGIGKLMQYVGRYYVQYFNHRHGRSGTLWEGRYRATLIDPEHYLLPVSHHIESQAVALGLVERPDGYEWSSYGANAGGADDDLVVSHAVYERLGHSASARQAAYARQARLPLAPGLVRTITESTDKAWVLGDELFCKRIESRLNRRAQPRPRGGDRRSQAYRQRAGLL